MHEHAAIGLEQQQSSRQRQVCAEAARVVDGATGYDKAHCSTLPGFHRVCSVPMIWQNSAELRAFMCP